MKDTPHMTETHQPTPRQASSASMMRQVQTLKGTGMTYEEIGGILGIGKQLAAYYGSKVKTAGKHVCSHCLRPLKRKP